MASNVSVKNPKIYKTNITKQIAAWDATYNEINNIPKDNDTETLWKSVHVELDKMLSDNEFDIMQYNTIDELVIYEQTNKNKYGGLHRPNAISTTTAVVDNYAVPISISHDKTYIEKQSLSLDIKSLDIESSDNNNNNKKLNEIRYFDISRKSADIINLKLPTIDPVQSIDKQSQSLNLMNYNFTNKDQIENDSARCMRSSTENTENNVVKDNPMIDKDTIHTTSYISRSDPIANQNHINYSYVSREATQSAYTVSTNVDTHTRTNEQIGSYTSTSAKGWPFCNTTNNNLGF
jgi:hypothetical protein